jgi:hypothetical protein
MYTAEVAPMEAQMTAAARFQGVTVIRASTDILMASLSKMGQQATARSTSVT